jgi:hypothetical protein
MIEMTPNSTTLSEKSVIVTSLVFILFNYAS